MDEDIHGALLVQRRVRSDETEALDSVEPFARASLELIGTHDAAAAGAGDGGERRGVEALQHVRPSSTQQRDQKEQPHDRRGGGGVRDLDGFATEYKLKLAAREFRIVFFFGQLQGCK